MSDRSNTPESNQAQLRAEALEHLSTLRGRSCETNDAEVIHRALDLYESAIAESGKPPSAKY